VIPPEKEEANPEWFREPTRREHWIAAGIFVGCGLFFLMMFFVLAGWWFRWVIIVLGIYSMIHGLRHARDAKRSRL
jgi:predicted membrane protein